MAGIYIHIPFCKKACHYCNFHFSTQTQHLDSFIEALIKEIQLQKNYLTNPINTLYIGGGTPSLLKEHHLNMLLEALHKNFSVASNIEFTLEANPDDINTVSAKNWKKMGINRLSIGIQSFNQKSLAWMNRAHNTDQSHAALQIVTQEGFTNISTDLIYGTPHLTDDDLLKDIEFLASYKVPHVSCYALTVEEKTALHDFIQKNKMEDVDVTQQARQFELLIKSLADNDVYQYEISNFSKKGFESKHNSNYWQGISYLGLGPSAHSFNGHSRQWNIANNALYIQSMGQEQLNFELENLPLATQYNEYMMTSLRQMIGFDLSKIKEKFGDPFYQHTKNISEYLLGKNQLQKTEKGYALDKSAFFFADGIASDFFIV
jgi:oxygen-independent coproporphyrinogen-3 oxidase